MFRLIFIDDIFQDGSITNEVHGEEEDDSKLGMLNKLCKTVFMGTMEVPESLHINYLLSQLRTTQAMQRNDHCSSVCN